MGRHATWIATVGLIVGLVGISSTANAALAPIEIPLVDADVWDDVNNLICSGCAESDADERRIVKLYLGPNFNCADSGFTKCSYGVWNGEETCDTGPFAPYTYYVDALRPYDWNDRMSSISSVSDCSTVRVWTDDGRSGAFIDCSPSCGDLGGFDEEASSLEMFG